MNSCVSMHIPVGLGGMHSRKSLKSNEGLVRLDVESQDLQQDPAEMGSTRSGHVCIQTDNSAKKVLQLETRPRDWEVYQHLQ